MFSLINISYAAYCCLFVTEVMKWNVDIVLLRYSKKRFYFGFTIKHISCHFFQIFSWLYTRFSSFLQYKTNQKPIHWPLVESEWEKFWREEKKLLSYCFIHTRITQFSIMIYKQKIKIEKPNTRKKVRDNIKNVSYLMNSLSLYISLTFFVCYYNTKIECFRKIFTSVSTFIKKGLYNL